MEIIAHRVYLNEIIIRNSLEALNRALENGYGFESDIRDFKGRLVISHNMADEKSPSANEVFEILRKHNDNCCFAINIKADGLKELLSQSLKKYQISNYFTFDMSVPQMIEYYDLGLKIFTRQSEAETEPIMYDKALGVWVDAFYDDDWITPKLLASHIANGKTVCIVSPDLHKREYLPFWQKLKGYDIDFSKLMLCTDHPDKAREFFCGSRRNQQ